MTLKRIESCKTRVVYRGHALDRSTYQWSPLRVCPHCLLEDRRQGDGPLHVRAYRRIAWSILPVRTCQIHACLLQMWSTGEMAHYAFAHHVAERLRDLPRMVTDTPPARPSAFERYLLARLEREVIATSEVSVNHEADGSWLDCLSAHAAARTCEMLGATEVFGPGVTAASMTDARWHEAAAVGFEIACRGEAAIRERLTAWQKAFRTRKDVPPSPASLGTFYPWLRQTQPSEAFEPLRAIVRRHLVETTPLDPGEIVLGETISERKVHTIHGAAKEFGVDPRRLRQALHTTGLINEDAGTLSDRQTVFNAVLARPVLDGLGKTMSLGVTGRYLSTTAQILKQLVEAGLIPATRVRGLLCFQKADLDAFLERLLARATDVAPHESLEALADAALLAKCPTWRIVRLVLDGRLRRIGRSPGEAGFACVAVDVDEVRYILRREHPLGLSLKDAADELVAKVEAVRELIAASYLPAAEDPETSEVRVPEAAFNALSAAYATAGRAAQRRRMHHKTFAKAFADLEPAFVLPSGTTFYAWKDIDLL